MIWLYIVQASITIAVFAQRGETRDLGFHDIYGHAPFGRLVKERMETSRPKRALPIKNGRGHGWWPNGVVSFAIDPIEFTPEDKSPILKAMQHFMDYTCVTFVEQYSTNMLQIKNDAGCYTALGMTGGSQTMSLGPSCRNTKSVLHYLGHVIGLIHEDQRPDRDDFVDVFLHNVLPSFAYHLSKYTWEEVDDDMKIPYDYQSIMQLKGNAFSRNGKYVIVPKDKTKVLGQSSSKGHLTFNDVKAIYLMYPCSADCSLSPSQCPDGLVGKDCKCWCKPENPGDVYKELKEIQRRF